MIGLSGAPMSNVTSRAGTSETPATEPGLVLWLRFNHDDRSTGLKSLPSLTPATPAKGFNEGFWDEVDGRTSMRFDGNTRLVFPVDAIPSGHAPYTIELTFKRQAGQYCGFGWMVPLIYGNEGQGSAVTGMGVHQQNDHISHFWWSNDLAPSSVGLHDGWIKYVVTWDGHTRKNYLEGRCVGTDTANNKQHGVPGGSPLVLGGLLREFGGEKHLAFYGWISEVKLHNRAKGEKEIDDGSGSGGGGSGGRSGSGGGAAAEEEALSPAECDMELKNSIWNAGKPVGGPESYEANPWRFDSNDRFVTERDGCNGRFQLRADSTAPGGVVLRMDWEAGQDGNYAEFARQSPGASPEWVSRGNSTYGFMNSWNIKRRGGSSGDNGGGGGGGGGGGQRIDQLWPGARGKSFKTGESPDAIAEHFQFTREGDTYVTTGDSSGRNTYSLSADGKTITHHEHAGVTAIIQSNGDLRWSHGYDSRIVSGGGGSATEEPSGGDGASLDRGGGGAVYTGDGKQGSVSYPYAPSGWLWGVSIAPDASYCLVGANYPHAGSPVPIYRIELDSGEMSNAVPSWGGSNPIGVAIAPNGTYALTTDTDRGRLAHIDLKTGQVTHPYTGLSHPTGVAISSSGRMALVDSGGSSVCRIDLDASGAQGKMTRDVFTGGRLSCDHTGFAFSPDESYALCANTARGTIARLDLRTNKCESSKYTGFRRVKGVAIAPSGHFALVCDLDGRRIGHIDLASGAVSFPYGNCFEQPFSVCFAPSGEFALFSCGVNGGPAERHKIGRIDFGGGGGGGTSRPSINTSLNGPLNDACRNTNDTNRIRQLVREGADLTSTNGAPWNHTGLHQASYHNRPEVVRVVVELAREQGLLTQMLNMGSNPCGRGGNGRPIDLASPFPEIQKVLREVGKIYSG